LALDEVDRPQNGIIPTTISTISRFSTSPSAKNLKTRRKTAAHQSYVIVDSQHQYVKEPIIGPSRFGV
jgi:hypothetical protein